MVTRLQARGYALFGAAFVLGVATGGAASHAYAEHSYAQLLGGDREETRDARRLEALARELGLSDGQREQVRGILERRRPERERRLAEMFETCGQGVLADKEGLEAEIRPLLRAEQQADFDVFVRRHRRFHAAPAESARGERVPQ